VESLHKVSGENESSETLVYDTCCTLPQGNTSRPEESLEKITEENQSD